MAVPGALAKLWLPGTAESQVVVFTAAKAGVKHGITKKKRFLRLKKASFPLLSLTLLLVAVYRGFWTAFILLAVAAGLVGGLLLVCGVPFSSPRSYKVGGGFLLLSGEGAWLGQGGFGVGAGGDGEPLWEMGLWCDQQMISLFPTGIKPLG